MTQQYVLTVENFLKIEKAVIPLDPGAQGFVGDNAQGKTTLLNALQELITGKNDLTKIRQGSDRAVIRLDAMENGEIVSTVQRVQTEGGSRLDAKGLKIGHTATTFLSSILSEISVNPINLLNDPVDYLKKHLDAAVEPEDYPEAAKILLTQLPAGVNGFTAAEMIAKKLAEDRLGTRKAMEMEEAVVRDLRVGMAEKRPEPPVDTEATLRQVEIELADRRASIGAAQEKKRAADEKVTACGRANARLSEGLLGFQKQEMELINKLEMVRGQVVTADEQLTQGKKELERLAREAEAIKVPLSNEIQDEYTKLNHRHEALKHYKHINDRFDTLDRRQDALQKLAAKFDALDAATKQVTYEIPKAIMKRCDLGVDGMEIREGNLFVNGFHISRLSTAERAVTLSKLAIAIAKRKGHVVVCLDGVESLDEAHRAEFLKAAQESGVCVLYTRYGKPELPFEHEVKDGKILN